MLPVFFLIFLISSSFANLDCVKDCTRFTCNTIATVDKCLVCPPAFIKNCLKQAIKSKILTEDQYNLLNLTSQMRPDWSAKMILNYNISESAVLPLLDKINPKRFRGIFSSEELQEKISYLNRNNNGIKHETCFDSLIPLDEGGANTLQLFVGKAKVNCLDQVDNYLNKITDIKPSVKQRQINKLRNDSREYIIKVQRKSSERENLKKLQDDSLLAEIALGNIKDIRNNKSVWFNLAFDEYNFDFAAQKNNKVYQISILPKAPGKSFKSYLSDFFKPNTKIDENKLSQSFFYLGRGLYFLHNLKRSENPCNINDSCSPYVHGDLHLANIFVDFEAVQPIITLIDLESMSKSLKSPLMPGRDFARLYGYTSSHFLKSRHGIKNLDLKKFHDVFFKSFIKGYVCSAPEVSRNQLIKELDHLFSRPQNLIFKTGQLNTVNPLELKESYETYLKGMFEKMQVNSQLCSNAP